MDDNDDKPDLAINHHIISIAHRTRFGVNWPGKDASGYALSEAGHYRQRALPIAWRPVHRA